MIHEPKRARRIRDLNRMKARAERLGQIKGIKGEPYLKLYNHLQSCSCRGCGNQRLWEGLSMQERRQL